MDTLEQFFSLSHCLLTNRYLLILKLDLQFFVEYLYEHIPLTEMLSSLKVAKKHVHVYCFHGKHFTCWDLRGILEIFIICVFEKLANNCFLFDLSMHNYIQVYFYANFHEQKLCFVQVPKGEIWMLYNCFLLHGIFT